MQHEDPFSRELRSARDRIAELQRRSRAGTRRGGGLLPEALAELDVAIEELSVTGEELQEQTVELAATRRALEAERERYQELFQSAPVAYLVTDPLARVLEANRAAAGLLGVDQRFLTGKPLAAYVASQDRWSFRRALTWLQGPDGGPIADRPVRFRRRGGEVVTVIVTVEPVREPGGDPRALRWLLRRSEEPVEPARTAVPAELAVEQDQVRRQHLRTLAELDPAADLDGTVQVLLDAGLRLLEVDAIGLMLADERGRLCAAGATDDATLAFLRAQEHLVKGPAVHAFLLERPVHSAGLDDDGRWPQLADAARVNRIGAVLATPIGLYGGPIGACLLVSATARSWVDADTAAGEAFAAMLAGLLELAAQAQRAVTAHRLPGLPPEQAVVEQAKGVLMARRGIDAEAAADALTELSHRSGRPVAEVAASLLGRVRRPLNPP
jgi:PAS domain S-box-containing protein